VSFSAATNYRFGALHPEQHQRAFIGTASQTIQADDFGTRRPPVESGASADKILANDLQIIAESV